MSRKNYAVFFAILLSLGTVPAIADVVGTGSTEPTTQDVVGTGEPTTAPGSKEDVGTGAPEDVGTGGQSVQSPVYQPSYRFLLSAFWATRWSWQRFF